MPLIKSRSKKALQKNIETEIHSGKDPKQAVAIGYAVRKAARKYEGGEMKKSPKKHPKMMESSVIKSNPRDEGNLSDYRSKHSSLSQDEHSKKASEIESGKEGMSKKYQENMDTLISYHKNEAKPKMAEGGEVDSMDQPEPEAEQEHHASIAAAIMAKRKMMADGGPVEENNEEQPMELNDLNEAALKENMNSDFMDMDQPEDSNMMGHEEEDQHDRSMISAIRRRMMSRRR